MRINCFSCVHNCENLLLPTPVVSVNQLRMRAQSLWTRKLDAPQYTSSPDHGCVPPTLEKIDKQKVL